MIKKLLAGVLIWGLGLGNVVFGQQIQWQKTIGGLSVDEANDIQCTNDGGYIICGSTASFGAGGWDVVLAKTDSAGTITWMKTYGRPGDDHGNSVQVTSDNGYIITGSTYAAGHDKALLIKTDSAGNEIWSKRYFHSSGDDIWGSSVLQTYDGGYVVAGQYNSWYGYPILFKTDASGNFIWMKYQVGFTNVVQLSNGLLVCAGTYSGYSYCYYSDTLGNCGMGRRFGGGLSSASLNAMCRTNDGGFVLAGSQITNFIPSDVYLVKLNYNMDTVWTKSYGGVNLETITSICQTANGDFIMAGFSNSFGTGDHDVLVIKTDSTGNLLASHVFGAGAGYDLANSIAVTPGGGFIIAGNTVNFGTVNCDMYLIKTNGMLASGCNNEQSVTLATEVASIDNSIVFTANYGPSMTVSVPQIIVHNVNPLISDPCTFPSGANELNEMSDITISPNPATDKITISFPEITSENITIKIYSITGEVVFEEKNKSATPITNYQIPIFNLSNGIYFLSVQTEKEMVTKKIVVNH